jgi:hypothetical protein
MEAHMKPIYSIVLASALAGSIGFAAVSEGPGSRARANAARMLEGRTAEPTVSCIDQRRVHGNQSLDGGGILFGEPRDAVVYVNQPPGGCPDLNHGRILITRTTGSRLCSGDIVTVAEPSRGPMAGSCGLADFTPYRRPR